MSSLITVSGATSERPELSKLWQAARARKIDTVLVWKFDRFARSTKQLIDALEEFRHLGVDFISITEQIDTSSPMRAGRGWGYAAAGIS